MTAPPVAIEVIGLVKRFEARRGWRGPVAGGEGKLALDRVDLAVGRGEVFGLLGPNGAGKTTLIKVLATLVLPDAGAARVAGLDVVRQSRAVRRRIGVVYGDERSFFWRLSALENLRFYAALYGLTGRPAERRIRQLLEVVGLAAAAEVRMHHFSSGMKQRVAIARGLLPDPEILFMDEPTHNLDPLAARELRALVRERVADGRRTVLLTTNIMAEAEELCHRVAFITRGQLQLVGAIGELQALLRAEDVHWLVVSDVGPATLAAARRLPGVRSLDATAAEHGRQRLRLVTWRHSRAAPLVVRAVVEAGGLVWSSVPEELSLERMFEMAIDGERQPRLVESEAR
jgi:ABC-2 type transport system ATP-binding protein